MRQDEEHERLHEAGKRCGELLQYLRDCGRDGATAAHHRTSEFGCGADDATSTGGGLRRQLQSVGEGRPLSPALVAALELLEGCLRLRP